MVNETPFKLPLKPLDGQSSVVRDDDGECVAIVQYVPDTGWHEGVRRDHIILAVNAFPRLVAVAKAYREECVEQITIADGDRIMVDAYTDDIRKIDAALAVSAGPVDDPSKKK